MGDEHAGGASKQGDEEAAHLGHTDLDQAATIASPRLFLNVAARLGWPRVWRRARRGWQPKAPARSWQGSCGGATSRRSAPRTNPAQPRSCSARSSPRWPSAAWSRAPSPPSSCPPDRRRGRRSSPRSWNASVAAAKSAATLGRGDG